MGQGFTCYNIHGVNSWCLQGPGSPCFCSTPSCLLRSDWSTKSQKQKQWTFCHFIPKYKLGCFITSLEALDSQINFSMMCKLASQHQFLGIYNKKSHRICQYGTQSSQFLFLEEKELKENSTCHLRSKISTVKCLLCFWFSKLISHSKCHTNQSMCCFCWQQAESISLSFSFLGSVALFPCYKHLFCHSVVHY